jgi:hypothetical protein
MEKNISGQRLNLFARLRNQWCGCRQRTSDHYVDSPSRTKLKGTPPEIVQAVSGNNLREQTSCLTHRTRSPTRVGKHHLTPDNLTATATKRSQNFVSGTMRDCNLKPSSGVRSTKQTIFLSLVQYVLALIHLRGKSGSQTRSFSFYRGSLEFSKISENRSHSTAFD